MIPDNYDLFQAHDRKQQQWLDRCPVCEHCDQPIQDEDLFDIDGTLYHTECAEQEFKKKTDDYMR